MPEYPIRYRLPTQYSTDIGRIITRWAFLEYRLKETAYMVLGIGPKIGRISVREPRVTDYVVMLQDLMLLKSLKTSVDLKKLRRKLETVQAFRDKLAHGIWVKHATTNLPVLQVIKGSYLPPHRGAIKVKARIDPLAAKVHLQGLKAIVHDIETTTVTINQWKRDLAEQIAEQPES